MKTRVFIVRHTETIGNVEKRLTGRQDYEITERGQVLIQKLTKELEKIKFDRAYSSTSRRAIKTIEPIVEKQNLKIEESDELCEMYFGIYDGWKWEDVNKIQPEIKQTQNEINEIVGIPGQESMEETAKRMYNYIFKIVKENEGKTILISSHGTICDEYAKKDSRIEVIHKANGGLSDARNVGISKAKGRYIGFVDSDDYIKEDMYEILLNLIKKYDADVSICNLYDVIDGNECIRNKENGIREYSRLDILKEVLLDKNIQSYAWNKLYEKELFDEIKYPIRKKYEDIGTTFYVFEKCNKNSKKNQKR